MTGDEQEFTPQEEPEDRSPYAIFATVGLIVVIVILILLFWRSCSAETTEDAASGGRVIGVVENLEQVDNVVSVWVRPGSSIGEVLDRNGLSSATVSDLGEGTYVIDIGNRDSERVVKALSNDPGLYDAGYLYEEE